MAKKWPKVLSFALPLIVALLATWGLLTAMASTASPANEGFDSSCLKGTYEAFQPEDHSVTVTRAHVTISCWISGTVRMWEARQNEMAGEDPSKPSFGVFLPIPQAAQCRWWGWQAQLWDGAGAVLAPRHSEEALVITSTVRTDATVDDPEGGAGAGFLIECSGVVGDQPDATATVAATPVPVEPWTCHQPMVALAAGVVITNALPSAEVNITGTLVVGQWQIVMPAPKHEFCLYLPAGTIEFRVAGSQVYDAAGRLLVDHETKTVQASTAGWYFIWEDAGEGAGIEILVSGIQLTCNTADSFVRGQQYGLCLAAVFNN